MAHNFNMDSRLWSISSSFHNGHIVSFQPEAVNSAADMISGEISDSLASMLTSSNPGLINNMGAPALSRSMSGGVLREPVPRFPHVSGSPAYWSTQDVDTLFEGLVRHANESNFQKYTKIASMLPAKTIRDVALRCQWMNGAGKRRKTEGYISRRLKEAKMILASQVIANNRMTSSENLSFNAATSPTVNHFNQFLTGDLEDAQHLLAQNIVLFGKIEANLTDNKHMLQMQDNVDLFRLVEKNIRATQDRISRLPNKIVKYSEEASELPALPESLNEELFKHLLSLNRTVVDAERGSSSFTPNPGYLRTG